MRRTLAVALAITGTTTVWSCRTPPEIVVTPAMVGPGQPIRIEVRLPRNRAPRDREVLIELRDGFDNRLGEYRTVTTHGRAEAWIEPWPPAIEQPLKLILSEVHHGKLRRLRTIRVPLDPRRTVIVPRLLDGFYPLEGTPPQDRYRWTGACLIAEIADPGTDAILHLRYRCDAEPLRQVRLLIAGLEAVRLPCADADRSLARVPLPHELWRSFPFLPVEVRVDPPFVPAAEGDSTDERELGIQLYAMTLIPVD